jgi:uncharacterized protein (DUF1778 family)
MLGVVAIPPSAKHENPSIIVHQQRSFFLTKAAQLRNVSIRDYVPMVIASQARRGVSQAQQNTIASTSEEQLAFWNALDAPPSLMKAQRELGRTMRGEQ